MWLKNNVITKISAHNLRLRSETLKDGKLRKPKMRKGRTFKD